MYSVAMAWAGTRLEAGNPNMVLDIATMKPIAAAEALQGQEFWAKNKKLARPLSPHLSIYKPQLTSMLSISHRITGCIQSGILSLAAVGVLVMPGNFPSVLAELQSMQLG